MLLILRNDEQIQVGTTTGLVAGLTSFTFDGTGSPAKPDYRNFEIIINEISGRGILVKGQDYSWNSSTGEFNLLLSGDEFQPNQWYNIHFQNLSSGVVPSPINTFIIDETFFIRDINIPNTANQDVLANLIEFIKKFEPICLKKVLGLSLYKKLLTESSTRMTSLLSGITYIVNGETKEWQGLVHDGNISLIANFIYYHWYESWSKITTGVATGTMSIEGGKGLSPELKMIDAWNYFSSESRDLLNFLWYNSSVYPEVTQSDLNYAANYISPINEFDI